MTIAKMRPSVGYVQGMNYIASVLLYHAGEEGAYVLLKVLLDKFDFQRVLISGFPGLKDHNKALLMKGRKKLPILFDHLLKHEI
jgi:hypothetical protein